MVLNTRIIGTDNLYKSELDNKGRQYMDAITKANKPGELAKMQELGQAANRAAAAHVFQEHTARKAKNTIRRKLADLALFAEFLEGVGMKPGELANDPGAWAGITWGLVEAFKAWQVKQGYAIPSVNGRLSTVRVYAGLAAKAGTLDPQQAALIQAVKGYARKEGKHVDDQRRAAGIETRKSTRGTGKARKNGEAYGTAKKAEAVTIPQDIAETLKAQPDSPQGQRDSLLMCLLLDHGLRVGEVAILELKNFDLKAGTLTFYRPKVDKAQTHELTADTRRAAKAYLVHAPQAGTIWRKTTKSGALSGPMTAGSTERALTKRVYTLGTQAGIEGLSAHDCRHFWATYEARHNTPIDRLQDAGGWTSPAMPLRYIESAHIANEGTARNPKKAHVDRMDDPAENHIKYE